MVGGFNRQLLYCLNLVTKLILVEVNFTFCGLLCFMSYFLSRRGYNIVINTWKRNDLLKRSVSHYALCSGLESIHIVWSEPDPPSESLLKFLHHVVQSNSKDVKNIVLKFDINKEDSLNNRFKEIKDLKTDAVFSIDDDIIFPCSSVEFAFNVWRSAPDTMVGFVPRMHWIDQSVCLISLSLFAFSVLFILSRLLMKFHHYVSSMLCLVSVV